MIYSITFNENFKDSIRLKDLKLILELNEKESVKQYVIKLIITNELAYLCDG